MYSQKFDGPIWCEFDIKKNVSGNKSRPILEGLKNLLMRDRCYKSPRFDSTWV